MWGEWEKIQMQNEVLDKLYKINRKYKDVKISDVGCYELKYEDVKKISKKELIKFYLSLLMIGFC